MQTRVQHAHASHSSQKLELSPFRFQLQFEASQDSDYKGEETISIWECFSSLPVDIQDRQASG